MKGVGRVPGWKVGRRGANDIEWTQTKGKRWVAVADVGRWGHELMFMHPSKKSRIFKGAGSEKRALAAAKKYMQAHPRK